MEFHIMKDIRKFRATWQYGQRIEYKVVERKNDDSSCKSAVNETSVLCCKLFHVGSCYEGPIRNCLVKKTMPNNVYPFQIQ